VRHNGADLVVPGSAGEIVVSAKLNGATIAQASLPAMSSDYVLKVPIDDGQEPRLTGTARGGERVRIYVRSVSLNVEYEATQSGGLGLVVSSIRGDIQPQDLTVTGSLGGLPPPFAGFGPWAGGFGIDPSGANLDSDGDGSTNLEEFVSGTDPTSMNDHFQIFEIRQAGGVTSIRYGPIRLSRAYSLFCSPDLSPSSWVKLSEDVPNITAPSLWRDHIPPQGTPEIFYKLEVDVQ
jgi:hypothetical protein